MEPWKRYIGKILVALICSCALFNMTLSAPVLAESKQVVRVAYFNMGDYYKYDEKGLTVGYDVAYLREIAKTADLSLEFVYCGTWAQALKMLENHQIDLVGTAQWSQEREEQYEFCLEPYSYTVAQLAQKKEGKLAYEDYEGIGRSTIGVVRNYVRLENVEQYCARHNIKPKYKYYDSQAALEQALEKDEVDLIATNSHTLKENTAIVASVFYSPFYFISWKGNTELTDKLDDSIIKIHIIKPHFDDNLFLQYFSKLSTLPLSKEELAVIAKNGQQTVYFDDNVRPLAWYDEEHKLMKGALIEIGRQISMSTGLKLEFKPISQKPATLNSKDISYTTLYYNSPLEDARNIDGATNALLDEKFNVFGRRDRMYDMEKDEISLAIVKNRGALKDYILSSYPKAKFVLYDNPLACLKAVQNGRADMAFLNVHVANNYIVEYGLNNLRELPFPGVVMGIGLRFRGENAQMMANIVNKGIQYLDWDKINNAMLQATLETIPQINAWSLMQRYPVASVFILLLIISLLVGAAVLVTYSRMVKRENKKVMAADKDRAEFFARMSHDMRTPMNGILGMLALSQGEENNEVLHSNIAKIKASSTYLLGLINDSLDLQKIETGNLTLEPTVIRVQDLIFGIVDMVKVSADEKKLDFELINKGIDFNAYIKCDVQRLHQIFVNILSNAIKFTPVGGIVKTRFERIRVTGNRYRDRIQIQDTGVGMTEEFLKEQLFTAYAQEQNDVTGRYAGSGLGMAIAKKLVELMGGSIWANSEIGDGTTVTVELEFEVISQEEARAQENKVCAQAALDLVNLQGRQILLVEDHPLNAEIIKRLLEKQGCRVVVAENGAKGVNLFKTQGQDFDAILMDIRMPVMDGLEATKQIRKLTSRKAATIPIIAMSANAYAEDRQKSLEAGMNAHLAKPVDPKVLYRTLENFIREKA